MRARRDRLRVHFELPQHGWLPITLESVGSRCVIPASHVLHDPLQAIADAVHALLLGAPAPRVATIFTEPDCIDLTFVPRAPGWLTLTAAPRPVSAREPDAPIFVWSGATRDVLLPFWRALRALRSRATTAELDEHWGLPFPEQRLDDITEILRRMPSPP